MISKSVEEYHKSACQDIHSSSSKSRDSTYSPNYSSTDGHHHEFSSFNNPSAERRFFDYTEPLPSYTSSYPETSLPSYSNYPGASSSSFQDSYVDCPLCGCSFHSDIIERHASTCGDV